MKPYENETNIKDEKSELETTHTTDHDIDEKEDTRVRDTTHKYKVTVSPCQNTTKNEENIKKSKQELSDINSHYEAISEVLGNKKKVWKHIKTNGN